MGKQTTQERFECPSQADLAGQRDDEHDSQRGAGKNDSRHERSFLGREGRIGELTPKP